MMNVIILNGSPRKQGNTEHIVSALGKALSSSGAAVTPYRLADLTIHPCIGCGTCEKEGICIFQDDMIKLYEEIARAERIILASAIYFYGLTAQTKACIDRCQTLWSRKYILKQPISKQKDRRGYLVSVSATRGKKVFDGAILSSRYGLDAMDATYSGELLFPGVEAKGTVDREPDFQEKIRLFAAQILTG